MYFEARPSPSCNIHATNSNYSDKHTLTADKSSPLGYLGKHNDAESSTICSTTKDGPATLKPAPPAQVFGTRTSNKSSPLGYLNIHVPVTVREWHSDTESSITRPLNLAQQCPTIRGDAHLASLTEPRLFGRRLLLLVLGLPTTVLPTTSGDIKPHDNYY